MRTQFFYLLPMVSPGTLSDPSEGSKKTSRTDEAESSKIEAKDGGSNELPFVMQIALKTYLPITQRIFINLGNQDSEDDGVRNGKDLP